MSNPAESVNVLVECFKNVAYQDDGLRSYNASLCPYGLQCYWHDGLTDYSCTSDGDLCTISTGNGGVNDFVAYGKFTNFGTWSTDIYRYLIIRAKTLTANAQWSAEIYYTPESNTMYPYQTNNTFNTTYFEIPSGGTVDRVFLNVKTTNGSDAKAVFDYFVISDTIPLTLTPSNFTVDNVLTEGFDSAELKCSYSDIINPDVGDHIKIWASKGNSISYHKIFTGIADRIRKISRGKEHRWVEIDASGYGKYLTTRQWKGKKNTIATDVIYDIVSTLIVDGVITATNIQPTSESIKVESIQPQPIMDLLRNDICTPTDGGLDWDFYVDYGSNLNVFQKGLIETEENLASDMFNFEHEKSLYKLINRQEVIGATNANYGNDTVWTESTIGWSASDGTGVTLGTNSNRTEKWYKEGEFGILIGQRYYNGGDLWGEKTIEPTPLLSFNGILKFYLKYLSGTSITANYTTLDLCVYMMTSNSDYFVKNKAIGGGDLQQQHWMYFSEQEFVTDYAWKLPWTEVELPIGPLAVNEDEWTEIGTPDWNNINKIRIQVNSPMPKINDIGCFAIDNMRIENVRCYGLYEDTISQNSYGVYEGDRLITDKLTTNEECTVAASLIVESYKNPIETIKNLEVSDNFGLTLGTEYIFNTLDINATLGVRKITHNLDNLQLTTAIDLSEKYIPSSDVLLSTFQRQLNILNHNLSLWKKLTSSKGVIEGKGKITDWWDLDPVTGIHSWIFSGGGLVQGSEADSFYAYGDPEASNWSMDLGEINLWVVSGPMPGGPQYVGLIAGSEAGVITHKLDYNSIIGISTVFKVKSVHDDSLCFIGAGGSATLDTDNVYSYLGFRQCGNILYGYSRNHTTPSSIIIATIETDTIYKVDLIYYPNDRIDFWIDNSYSGSISTNLPDENLTQAHFFTHSFNPLLTGQTLTLYSYHVGEFKT